MVSRFFSLLCLVVLSACKTVAVQGTPPESPHPQQPDSAETKPSSKKPAPNRPVGRADTRTSPDGGETGANTNLPSAPSESRGGGLGSSSGSSSVAAAVSKIQPLNDTAKIRLMAAAAASSYCGDDTSCAVGQRFQESSERLRNSFNLKDWNIRLIAVRDAILDVEGYVFFKASEPDVIIAFRGSEVDFSPGSFNDWINVNARALAREFQGSKLTGRVHEGFLDGATGIWQHQEQGLRRLIQAERLAQKNFWVTGHSQGGAIAVLIASLLVEESLSVRGVYAYGMPRIASQDFQTSYNRVLGEVTIAIANQSDPVPRVPAQFTAVGANFQIVPPRMQRLGKDGLPPWDIISAATLGNANHHTLTDEEQGYFAGI